MQLLTLEMHLNLQVAGDRDLGLNSGHNNLSQNLEST